MATTSPPSPEQVREEAARAVLAPVIEFLGRHAPFDQMAAGHIEFLAKHLKLGFHARGEVITEPGQGAARTFYIIKQGRVRGEAASGSAGSDEGAWELVTGECFPIGALLARRPVHTVHRAVDDTFCFELDGPDFDRLLAMSPVFHDFCSRRLANLLDQALRGMQADVATTASADLSLNTPLRALLRRAPVVCTPGAPIRQALALMHGERVGSVVIVDDSQRPLGVFTLHDLLSRVVTMNMSLDAAIAQAMTAAPVALPPEANAHEAALLMAQKGVGHLCVVERGKLVGVVSERDLFALQRIGIVSLTRAITQAPEIDALVRLGDDIHRLIDQMLAQGASVNQLTQLITQLNDHITRRVIALCLADHDPGIAFTWLAFGSEGRLEQTLKTDQDNGILFRVPEGQTAAAAREKLLPLARRINEALDRCGYPLCQGNIMASNPDCCLSQDEWRSRFERWIDQGTPEHLLKASIFFDFRALWGDAAPVDALRASLLARMRETPRFLRMMAQNALRNRPPLGFMQGFVVSQGGDHPHTFDLKLQGTTPFVDAARLLALAHGVGETNTPARLRAAATAGVVRGDEAEAWCDAYSYIQLLRMRRHQQQEARGEPLNNYADPDSFNELDRRILKEAFRQARKLQDRIALDYQL